MQNNFPETLDDKAEKLGEKVADGTTQLKDRVSEFGRTAADSIDQNLGAAASGLDKAANSLHAKADNLPGVDKARTLAHSAADKLSATAGYVREHDVKRMMADLKTFVQNNPGPSLLAVGVIGFLVGRSLHRSHND